MSDFARAETCVFFGLYINKKLWAADSKATRDCKNARTLVNNFEKIELKNIVQPQHELPEWNIS